VCPYNRVAEAGDAAPFEPLERFASLDLAALVGLDEAGFAALTEGSALRRATRRTLASSATRLAARRLASHPEDRDARAAMAAADQHDDPAVVRLARQLRGPE
jgi:epoxyqueuosine reductase QueG